MRKDILVLDEPNLNNRIYVRDSFKDIPESVPVIVGDYYEDTHKVVGSASGFQFNDGILSCDVSVADQATLDALLTGPSIAYVPCGEGNIEPVGSANKVIDYQLKMVSAILASESSFPRIHGATN